MRILTIFLVIAMLSLAACSGDEVKDKVEDTVKDAVNNTVDAIKNLNTSEDYSDEIVGLVDGVIGDDKESEEEAEEQLKSQTLEYVAPEAEFVTKNIGEFDYEETEDVSITINGKEYSSKRAVYEWNDVKSYAYLIPGKVSQGKSFLNLSEEYKEHIYFDPVANQYLWQSTGFTVVIERSFGFEMVEEYLDDYPYSQWSDEKTFELKDEPIVVVYKDKVYVFENKRDLIVNGEEYDLAEKMIVSDLLIEYDEDENEIQIISDLENYAVLELEGFEMVGFEFQGAHSVQIKDADDDEILLSVDSVEKRLEEGETMKVGDMNVLVSDLLIGNVGETLVLVRLELWE